MLVPGCTCVVSLSILDSDKLFIQKGVICVWSWKEFKVDQFRRNRNKLLARTVSMRISEVLLRVLQVC